MDIPNRRQLAAFLVLAVALAAAGGAFADSKLHHRSASVSAGGFGFPPGGGPRRGDDDLRAAAAYLGLSPAALQQRLQAGETLAQVADATGGKSASGLIDTLVEHARQAGIADPALRARVTARVNGSIPRLRAT